MAEDVVAEDLVEIKIQVGSTVRDDPDAVGNVSKRTDFSASSSDRKIGSELGEGLAIWSMSGKHLVRIVEPDGVVDDDPYGRSDWHRIISQVASLGNNEIRWICQKRYDENSLRENLERVAKDVFEQAKKREAAAGRSSRQV